MKKTPSIRKSGISLKDEKRKREKEDGNVPRVFTETYHSVNLFLTDIKKNIETRPVGLPRRHSHDSVLTHHHWFGLTGRLN